MSFKGQFLDYSMMEMGNMALLRVSMHKRSLVFGKEGNPEVV